MKVRHLLQLFLLSAVWGVSFLMIRIAGLDFPPAWLGLLRCVAGASLLWVVLVLGGRKLPPRRLIFWLLLVALTNNALPFSFFAWGERIVPSSTAAVLNGTTPIWTLLLSLAVTGKRASLNTILGVILGFTGVALAVSSFSSKEATSAQHSHALWGIFVIGMGALGYAIATIIAKTKLQNLDPIGLATTQLSLAALMLLPVTFVTPHPAQIHLQSLLAILVLGLFGSGFAYLLYYSLLAQISATQVAAVTYLLPLWGMFWGAIAHEAPTAVGYLGSAIVVAGLVLMNRRPTPRAQPVEAGADASTFTIECHR